MLTQEDLQAIGALFDKRFTQEREFTRQIVKEEARAIVKEKLALNNKVIGTIIRVEIAEAKQEIVKAMKAGFRAIVAHEQKQDKQLDNHQSPYSPT